MNITHIVIKSILIFQLFSYFPMTMNNRSEITEPINIEKEKVTNADIALGVWRCKFINENINPVYKDGMLFVTKQKGKYDVVVKFSNGLLSGQDVFVSDDQIKFHVNIDGLERLSFVLQINGNQIIGESYSVKGASRVLGKRQVPVR